MNQHPLPKTEHGKVLASSIHKFANSHNPTIKYTGMRTAIDVLTACHSPEGDNYPFHYEIISYRQDGVYIKKVPGEGYRTPKEDVLEMRKQAGFED